MGIVSLTLNGCKRLLLNNIYSFTITPKEIVQLIIGTNGSGKSSVIRLLSPLPADSNTFTKDGSKIFIARKNGSTFVCKSTFTPSTKHSFTRHDISCNGKECICDYEELNPGGTERVQNELAKEHFQITPMIHDLLTGDEKFHEMSPTRRRTWFTLLCDTDYDFALSAYEKIKERHRDIAGGLKIYNKNLVTETAKIISREEEEHLEIEVKELLRELDIVMAERQPLDTPIEQYVTNKEDVLIYIQEISTTLLKFNLIAPLEYCNGKVIRNDWGELKRVSFKSIFEIDEEINTLKHSITASEATLSISTENFNKLQKNYDILVKAGQEGVQSLIEQRHKLNEEMITVLNRKKLSIDLIPDPLVAQQAFDGIANSFYELLGNLPRNQDRQFGQNKLRECQTKLISLEEKKNQLRLECIKLKTECDHADHHRSSSKAICPQCNHSFVIGINEKEYHLAKERIEEINNELIIISKDHDLILQSIKDIESYFEQYRKFIHYTKSVVILKPFWGYLIVEQYVLDSPAEAINITKQFQRDLECDVEAFNIRSKITEIENLRLSAEAIGNTNIQEIKDEMDRVTIQLGEMTNSLMHLRKSVLAYSDYRKLIIQSQTLTDKLKELLKDANKLQWDYIEAIRTESILQCISQIQQVLATKQEALRHVKMQKAIVEELKNQVKKLVVDEESSKLLVQALSPTHGLIAEGLLGFIRHFVGHMNKFIKQVWSYPLQVIPTGYDESSDDSSTALDYKFKMTVGEYNNTVPDVSNGSDGINEITDLAFKLTAIHCLKLTDVCLFLDEVGRSMSEDHRFNLVEAIKTVLNERNFTQLWMISHFIQNYSAFSNAEVCNLSTDKLAISEHYNRHVLITT